MYLIDADKKNTLQKQWALPDRIFFACGACQVLAYAFLEKFPDKSFRPFWIKPAAGFRGNHIFVSDGNAAFDYHGYSNKETLLRHVFTKARRWFDGWDAEIIELPKHVLIDEAESKKHPGLWLRQPDQFLHNALPRAEKYLNRFSHNI